MMDLTVALTSHLTSNGGHTNRGGLPRARSCIVACFGEGGNKKKRHGNFNDD